MATDSQIKLIISAFKICESVAIELIGKTILILFCTNKK